MNNFIHQLKNLEYLQTSYVTLVTNRYTILDENKLVKVAISLKSMILKKTWVYLTWYIEHGQSWAERRSKERRSGAPLGRLGAGAGAPLFFQVWSESGSAATF